MLNSPSIQPEHLTCQMIKRLRNLSRKVEAKREVKALNGGFV